MQFNRHDTKLILSARLVNRDVALNNDLLTILQEIATALGLAPKQHATQLGAGILQREINVTRTLGAEIRDFARYPNLPDLFLQSAFDLRGQFCDRQHLPCCFQRKQLAEVPLRFGLLAHQTFWLFNNSSITDRC